MNKHDQRRLQSAIAEFVNEQDFGASCSVTLTLRRAKLTPAGLIYISREDCIQNLRHFLNVLNRRLHGNSVRRGVRLNCFSVLEIDEITRPHYHLQIAKPTELSLEEFTYLIWTIWRNTFWGHEIVDVQSSDAGWVFYMTKLRSKDKYDLCIDWLNTHF